MKKIKARWLALTFLTMAGPAFGQVVINEIMYHQYSERVDEEYIELYNNSANATNLLGWKFTKGVSFTFTNPVLIPARGYMVVAANLAAFNLKYDVGNVVGDWVGTLRNSGEKIELEDAEGNVVSSVYYSKAGDWGVRLRGAGEYNVLSLTRSGSSGVALVPAANYRAGDTFTMSGADQPEYNTVGLASISTANNTLPRTVTSFTYPISGAPASPATGRIIFRQISDAGLTGWSWSSRADGFGSSLELVNANMPNAYGQNWLPSAVADGTPGLVNSVVQTNIAPLIVDLQHYPPVPQSSTPVTVTARIVDEHTNGKVVTLYWRVDVNPPGAWQTMSMEDDGLHNDALPGDGIYGAILPAQANNAIVEFYVQAQDSESNTRTYPAPALNEYDDAIQEANAFFQVDDVGYGGSSPIYRVIMRQSDWAAFQNFPSSSPWSDAGMNMTFIAVDGGGTEVRYNCEIRDRGAGTRGRNPTNHKISFPSDRPFNGVDCFNLNNQYTESQMVGYVLSLQAGLPTEYGRLVQVRFNNLNRANNFSPQFGHYMELQTTDGNYANTHWPTDSEGHIYRCSSWGHTATLSFSTYGSNWVGYVNDGFTKQTHADENNWGDFFNLLQVLNRPVDAGYEAAIRQVINVDEWMLYQAMFQLTLSRETSLGTGSVDDFSMYRGEVDQRFMLLGHDWDTILNQGDTHGGWTDDIFRAATIPQINSFMRHQAFVPIYYRELKRVCDTVFHPTNISRTIDAALAGITPQATNDAIKTFASNRWYYVLGRIPTNLTVAGPSSTTSPSVTLNGQANVIDTRSVLVNGTTATWSAWQGTWAASVSLLPGINRVLVQSLNSNGVEFARATYDVFYDDLNTTAVSGALAGSNYWAAANGPYNVTAALSIPNGATLVIQPGTTVYIAGGASITVSGSGRLLAEGTDRQHIRFTRVPAGGNWGSLAFVGAAQESRLAYVDIDFCGGVNVGGYTAEVHVNGGSRVFFDHLTFTNNPVVQYISFDGSSFIVQNCYFPTYPGPTGPEMLHGANGINAGGYGIFRDNYFGHTWRANDTIDFTGGNRPGPILQIIGNVFDGASDDHLDLDSTDAWIEGNIFLHAHRDPASTSDPRDTASAISGGTDTGGVYSEWTIINNLFYDVDHACLAKQGARFTFVNNTVVHVNKESGGGLTSDIAAFDFTDNGLPLPDPTIGAGAYVAGNIIWDAPMLTANYNPANHTVIFENNILPMAWSGPGSNNVVTDPLLNLSLITDVATADWQTVKAALQPRSCSPALGAGIGGFDAGGFNPRGLLISGEPPSLTTSNRATLRVFPGGTFNWGTVVPPYAWGYTNYKWKLDDGAWSAPLSITASPTIVLSNLALGPHTVYVSGKNDAGYYQDDPFVYPTNGIVPAHVTASRTWIVTNAGSGLRINEILASNQRAVLHGDGYPDLLELYNDSESMIDLTGMGITDDTNSPYKYMFPLGTFLPGREYLILYADNPDGTPGLHLGFRLNKDGGGIYLYDKGSPALVDTVDYGIQVADWSIGRIDPDGNWGLTYPTFGRANRGAPAGDPYRLRINEWLAAEVYAYGSDFVELYNPDPAPTPLGGLYLTDNVTGWPTRHRIATLSFIPASGYSVFRADGRAEAGADHLNFQLDAERGVIGLIGSDLSVIDYVIYGPQFTDISQGRSPSGSPGIVFFSTPTPGAGNPGNVGGCTVSNIVLNLMPLTYSWKYDASDVLDGVNWTATNYNDAGWSGPSPALFAYNEDNTSVGPINTTLYVQRTTYYYRTSFVLTNDLSLYSILASGKIDDGMVLYVNGAVVPTRVRMDAGTVYYSTYANSTPSGGDATGVDTFTIANSYFHAGTNYLAAEIHDVGSGTRDMVWGLQLDAMRSVTNCVQISVVFNEVLANSKTPSGTNTVPFDWVELYNPSANPVDLTDMSLTDDSALPRRWVFPAGVSMVPGQYLLVRCDGANLASTNNGPVLNTGFGLKAEGGRVFLFDTLARGGELDALAYGQQAADYSIGRIPDGTGSWMLNVPNPEGANIAASVGDARFIRINEWMARDNNGPDWFEIYNPNAQPVSIGGLYVTDDLTDRTLCQFAPLSFIGVGEYGYAQFIADEGTDPNHVCFRLAAGGDEIGIFPATGPAIDTISFGPQDVNVSAGRFPDGSTNFMKFPGTATPAAANFLPLTDVVVNEVLSHTDPPFEDAIELHNTTMRSIDIGGWYLTDNKNDPRRFRIPDHTIIPPNGFVVFYEYQFNPDFSSRPPYFGLSGGHGDDVYLFSADAEGILLGYRTDAKFEPAENAVSIGRYLSSIDYDFVPLSQRTFGVDNPASTNEFRTGAGLSNAYPKVGPVVINEIMYHPPGTNGDLYEFIELHNITAQPVALYNTNYPTNTWRIRDAVDFDFPTNVVLPANGHLLVVSFNPQVDITSLTNFCAYYGLATNAPLYGPWQGRLANDDEPVELYKPDEPEPVGTPEAGFVPYVFVERVHYYDTKPWASAADGTNGVAVSLQRKPGALYGNDPVNWYAGLATPGAANGAAFGPVPDIISLTPSHTALLGTNDILSVVATGGGLAYQWYFNGKPVANALYNTLGVMNVRATNAGDYIVVISNPNGTVAGRIHLDVAQPPVISGQPQNQFAPLSGTAVFSVTVLGSMPLSYQWQKDGTNLPGQTGVLLVITNVQASDEASYRVVVTNKYGLVTSDYATLSLSALPAIVRQPRSTNVFVGATVTFDVLASGTAPLRYQWRKNGASIPFATNTSLTLPSVGTNDAGSYTVYITNRVGSVLSAPAVLTVVVPPTVTILPLDANASEPGSNTGTLMIFRSGTTSLPLTVNIGVTGNATPGVDYVAFSSPVIIPAGSPSTNLIVIPLDDAVPEGDETVTVTLLAGAEYVLGGQFSATVTIRDNDNVAPTVVLTNPPAGLLLDAPARVDLAATASDSDGTVLKVAFYSNETNKIGEVTSAPYALAWTNVPAGNYQLTAVATDNLGSSGVSAPVSITINALPVVSITNPVENASFYAPALIRIDVSASDPDGTVTQVQFYNGNILLGTVTNGPFTLTWSNGVVGSYTLLAVATDNRGATNGSAPVNILVTPPALGFTDNFSNRPNLGGFTNFIFGNNSTWTKEPGERNHADAQGGHSGWISWTAPASGQCVAQTVATGLAGVSNIFDTVLAVYTGDSLSNLAWVASNDDMTNSMSLQSFLAFYAVAGTTYQIAVDGWIASSTGNFYFRMGITNPFPVIITPPSSVSVLQGATATFSVVAGGAGPLAYQWQFNAENIDGATGTNLSLIGVQSSNEGPYRVMVSNSSGSVTSAPAILTVRVPPNILTQPQTQLVNVGETASFSVVATGSLPMQYQWRWNGGNVAGATNAAWTINNVQYTNAGTVHVRVMNSGGLVQSQTVELNVRPRFVASQMQSNGVFILIGEGVIGKTYAVEWAANLTNWASLGAISNAAIQMQYYDSNAVATPKFYRFRQTP